MIKTEMDGLSHIPTFEIEKDISDTQKEINDYRDELTVLMRNPHLIIFVKKFLFKFPSVFLYCQPFMAWVTPM